MANLERKKGKERCVVCYQYMTNEPKKQQHKQQQGQHRLLYILSWNSSFFIVSPHPFKILTFPPSPEDLLYPSLCCLCPLPCLQPPPLEPPPDIKELKDGDTDKHDGFEQRWDDHFAVVIFVCCAYMDTQVMDDFNVIRAEGEKDEHRVGFFFHPCKRSDYKGKRETQRERNRESASLPAVWRARRCRSLYCLVWMSFNVRPMRSELFRSRARSAVVCMHRVVTKFYVEW